MSPTMYDFMGENWEIIPKLSPNSHLISSNESLDPDEISKIIQSLSSGEILAAVGGAQSGMFVVLYQSLLELFQ